MANNNHKGNKKSRKGQLRIVAGIWRSRRLEIADLPGLRPTSERIRETLFNWLAPTIAGSRCLDLCAGTGALGLEALSRGASETVFVDPSQQAIATLAGNVDLLGADDAQLVRADARIFLDGEPGSPFDVVFIDPPFSSGLYEELCRLLVDRGWLVPGGHIYLEMDKKVAVNFLPEGWTVLKDKTAGNVRYLLARN